MKAWICSPSQSSLRDFRRDYANRSPSDESLGYSQMPLPGQEAAALFHLVCNNPVPAARLIVLAAPSPSPSHPAFLPTTKARTPPASPPVGYR